MIPCGWCGQLTETAKCSNCGRDATYWLKHLRDDIQGAGGTLAAATAKVGATSASHSHPESEVTNLTTDLAAKAPTHAHPYAATSHAHAETDVTTLVFDLASKAPSSHSHSYESQGAVAAHAALADPHPTYLTAVEGSAAYEATGAVTAHAGAANPHPVYATDTDLSTHAATPHGGTHPDLAAHDTLGLATDSELTTHAGTAHGLSAHVIDGAFHTGTAVLPTQGQKNALAGTSGTPGTGNEFVTTQDARNTNARTPTAHAHAASEVTGTAVVTADPRLSDARTPTTHAHVPADTTGTAVITTDARLSNARTPTAHSHAPAEVTGTAVVTADARLFDARTPVAHSHTPADTTGTAVVTGDARLSDARTPLAHTHAPVYAALANGAVAMAFGTNGTVKVTPTVTATYTTTVPAAGTHVHLIVLTAGVSSFTITFGTGFKPTATLVTGTTAARVFALSWISDGSNLYEVSRTVAMVA